MSIDAIAYVKTLEVESPTSRLILWAIAENTYNDSGLCRVGQQIIADDVGVSERTLRNHLDKLDVDAEGGSGHIKRHPQYKDGGGRAFDAIELVGFRAWFEANRANRKRSQMAANDGQESDGIPANSAGMEGETIPEKVAGMVEGGIPASRIPVHTGKQVAGINKDSRTSTSVQDSPPTPRGGAREGGLELLIEELRAEGKPAHVLDQLLLPLVGGLIIGHPNPRAFFCQIIDTVADKPGRVLAMVAAELLTGQDRRGKIVAVKNVVDVLQKVIPKASIKITPDHPGHDAWRAYHAAKGATGKLSLLKNQGFIWELAHFPPGHPTSDLPPEPAATTGAAA